MQLTKTVGDVTSILPQQFNPNRFNLLKAPGSSGCVGSVVDRGYMGIPDIPRLLDRKKNTQQPLFVLKDGCI